MTQEGVPKKSSFGNKFSNFWFWFETGIKLEDTQSGYRLYPLKTIPKNYFTRKFEFEIEVIVRSAWNGVAVKNVPIKVLYDPSERVSHFRPFKDFTRIEAKRPGKVEKINEAAAALAINDYVAGKRSKEQGSAKYNLIDYEYGKKLEKIELLNINNIIFLQHV